MCASKAASPPHPLSLWDAVGREKSVGEAEKVAGGEEGGQQEVVGTVDQLCQVHRKRIFPVKYCCTDDVESTIAFISCATD